MNIGISFLRSRIARRFFLLFLGCAFVPTVLLVIYSYQQVRDQLYEQSWTRLDKDCKVFAMALMDRLVHMNNLAQLYATALDSGRDVSEVTDTLRGQLTSMFDGFALYRPASGMSVLFGQVDLDPDPDTLADLIEQPGKTLLLLSETGGGRGRQLHLLVPYATSQESGVLIACPISSVLWGVGVNSMLPPMTELAIYDSDGRKIMATEVTPGEMLPATGTRNRVGNYLRFTFPTAGGEYLASGWSLFLRSHFQGQTWTIILSESRSSVLGAMLEFKRIFPLIILLALWIILFLSLTFIRRTLAPLGVLQQGTERIGRRDFSGRVEISSGDEFEQLAHSFNGMSSRLEKQFHALNLIGDIDRSILSSIDSKVIIPKALRLISEFFGNRRIMLVQRNADGVNRMRVIHLDQGPRNDIEEHYVEISDEERRRLFAGKPVRILGPSTFLPRFLADGGEDATYIFLPLAAEGKASGALILAAGTEQIAETDEEVEQARQFADQLAVALDNARLVNDLEQLSIGTVEALARTVDAKSKWTAGHSERVAGLAVRIGRAMGLEQHSLDLLYRGGLLHDIGKIGIPVSLLDKPGKLDDEEYRTVQTHPQIGGKILEPIQVYKDILPLVVQHHERFDGKGYPLALAGTAIDLGARILALADVYDALISQRPYRQGWVKENVIGFIEENSGSMFDPAVVEVFLAMDI